MDDGLAPTPRRLEDLAFHDARSALAGHPDWRVVSYSTCFLVSRASDTSVASPLTVTALSHEWGFLGPPRQCRRPFREDKVSCFRPRCLPSTRDTRAPARAATDLECGHVMGFRFDSALDAVSPRVAALRFWRSLAGHGLDPRPRALPQSGEKKNARFSESDAAHRLLQRYDNDARAHPSSARSSPALNTRPFLEPRTLRVCPRFPYCSFRSRYGVRLAQPFRDERAASHVSPNNARLPALQARRQVETPKATALHEHRLRAAIATPPSVCAGNGLKR